MKDKSIYVGGLGLLLIFAGIITYAIFNNPETIDYDGDNYIKTFYRKVDRNLVNDAINFVNTTRKREELPANDYDAIIIPIKDDLYVEGYTFVVKYLKDRKVNYAFNAISKDNNFIILTSITNIEKGDFTPSKSNFTEAIKKYMYKELSKGDYDIDLSLVDYYKNNNGTIMIDKEEYKVVKVLDK